MTQPDQSESVWRRLEIAKDALDFQRRKARRLEAENERVREALALVRSVLVDEKGDKINRARLVVDTALAIRVVSDERDE
jgi:hypothetical protein